MAGSGLIVGMGRTARRGLNRASSRVLSGVDPSRRECQPACGPDEIEIWRSAQRLNQRSPLLNDVVASRGRVAHGIDAGRMQHAFDGHRLSVAKVRRQEN